MQHSVLVYRVGVHHEGTLGESDRLEVADIVAGVIGATTDHGAEVVSCDLDEELTGDGETEDLIS